MNEKTYTIPYGKGQITFDLPSDMCGTVIVSKKVPPIADVEAAIAEALAGPVNSPPPASSLPTSPAPARTTCWCPRCWQS